MDRTYKVIGIAKCVLIYRGMVIQPRHKFDLVLTQKEYDTFKDHIEILDVSEPNVIDVQPESIIEISKENIEPEKEIKKETENAKPKSFNKSSKKQHS